jgi:hypothetical protein
LKCGVLKCGALSRAGFLLAAGLLLTLIAPASARELSARWVPAPGTTWQWQLTVPVDLSVEADVYDIDGFDNSARVVARLHARGRRAICYIDAGAYEDYRPDAARFPASVLGKPSPLWEGERWLDIRRLDVLAPIMRGRLDMCRAKGFDGVELDEIDGWSNDTGFPLTAADQLRYNRFLAREVRARGMSAGLKNDLEQIPQLVKSFDFAIDEECFQYRECDALKPFVAAGKAVFHTEYRLAPEDFCPVATALGLSSMRKRLDLGAWRVYCRAPRALVGAAGLRASGKVVLRLTCPGFSRCSGTATLRALGSPVRIVARARYVVAAGAERWVSAPLTRSGRTLLSGQRRLRVVVVAVTRNGPARPTRSRRVVVLSVPS